jgi:tol-pal system protein YbgF
LRIRWFAVALAVLLVGALGGAILAPAPAGAVSKEIIQLQQQVAQLLQGQQDLRSALDQKDAELKTLLEQSLDSVSKLNSSMSVLEKNVLDAQANSGSRIDTLATQTQGISDNLQDVQARVGKLSQQMADIQGVLQSIDAKVSGGAPAGGGTNPNANPGNPATPPANQPAAGGPPPSADVLYTSALRDYSVGKYDLARQEFTDYLRYFPTTDLASNAQFYLGEIDYAQADFAGAIAQYDKVILGYPKSYKQGAARLKKGDALLETGQRAAALREFREVVRRYPGSEEAKRAQAKLRELGSPHTPSR